MKDVEIINKNLPETFNRLLNQYAETLENHANQNKVNCGYWYSERPNISILASAASAIGYLPLEELLTTKSIKSEDKSSEWKGRIDLKVSDADNEIDLLFEAKHTYCYKKGMEDKYLDAVSDCSYLNSATYLQKKI